MDILSNRMITSLGSKDGEDFGKVKETQEGLRVEIAFELSL